MININKLPLQALYINQNTILEVLITQTIDNNNLIVLYQNRFSNPIYFISSIEYLYKTDNTYYEIEKTPFNDIIYINYKLLELNEISNLKLNPLYIDIEPLLYENIKTIPIIKKRYNKIISIQINKKEFKLNQIIKFQKYNAKIIEITNNLRFKIQFPRNKEIIEITYDSLN